MSETVSTNSKNGFEPRIVAFVCKWCTYAGADLAGTSRMEYASNVRTLMLPCTGRIDVSFVLRAFLDGADGVMVSGCHPGDCHYTAGNFRARRRWILFRDLLDVMGVDLKRFDLAWISAAEGAKWVNTIQSFTDKIRTMGPYDAMHRLSAEQAPEIAPATGPVASNSEKARPADSELTQAVGEAFTSGKVKAVIGWTRSATFSRPRPAWIVSAEAAGELVAGGSSGNLARLLKNPKLKATQPLGIVADRSEALSLNVLAQEAQIDPSQIVLFALNDGKYLGTMDLATASKRMIEGLPTDRPTGFSDSTWQTLDSLMTKSPGERWAFWREHSARCVKCYACRGSCPMCGCTQCFTDKNQPQWFPTAADGPGNFSWHVMRAFHLAGRCVGCGSCTDACPVGIPLDLLNAAMARSAFKHFSHRAGLSPSAAPLQADYLPGDKEDFIL